MPLSGNDLEQLAETASFLKQFSGFSHFQELSGMAQKLEDHIHSKSTHKTPIIDFEKNENLKGLSYLDILYQAIKKKQVLKLYYKSFKAREASSMEFHAYLLKEFNNRWFIVGVNGNNTKTVLTLALDRIESAKTLVQKRYIENTIMDPATYYEHVVGVTVVNGIVEPIEIFIDKYNAPYVITKPLHHSQKILKSDENGTYIEINVLVNFELERLILGFGESMKVISPRRLRRRLKKKFGMAFKNYSSNLPNYD